MLEITIHLCYLISGGVSYLIAFHCKLLLVSYRLQIFSCKFTVPSADSSNPERTVSGSYTGTDRPTKSRYRRKEWRAALRE